MIPVLSPTQDKDTEPLRSSNTCWCVLLASLLTKSWTPPQSSSSPGALRRQRPPRGAGPPGAAARSPQLTPTGPDQRDSGAAGGGGASSRSWPSVAGGSSWRRKRRRPRPWGQRERRGSPDPARPSSLARRRLCGRKSNRCLCSFHRPRLSGRRAPAGQPSAPEPPFGSCRADAAAGPGFGL